MQWSIVWQEDASETEGNRKQLRFKGIDPRDKDRPGRMARREWYKDAEVGVWSDKHG